MRARESVEVIELQVARLRTPVPALIDEEQYEETGVALTTTTASGSPQAFTTDDFAARAGDAVLTGVAYTDAIVPDHFYTIGSASKMLARVRRSVCPFCLHDVIGSTREAVPDNNLETLPSA